MIASMANNTLWHPKFPDNNMAMAYLLVAKKINPQLKPGLASYCKAYFKRKIIWNV
jgi:hypothetical protein